MSQGWPVTLRDDTCPLWERYPGIVTACGWWDEQVPDLTSGPPHCTSTWVLGSTVGGIACGISTHGSY